jgi:methyl-accepting chemotaxis protein
MRLVRNLPLSIKLLVAPVVGLIALAVLGVFAYWSLSNQHVSTAGLYDENFKGYQTIASFVTRLGRIHANAYKITTLASSTTDMDAVEKLAAEQMGSLQTLLNEVAAWRAREFGETDDPESFANRNRALLDEYQEHALGVADLATVDVGMATTYMSLAEETFQTLSAQLDEILSQEDALGEERYGAVMAASKRALGVFALIFAAAAAVVLFTSLLVARMIAVPVRHTHRFIEEMSHGGLRSRIDVHGADEIGRMCACLNEFVEKLGGMVRDISSKASTVAGASGELSKASENMVGRANKQSSDADELARLAQDISSTAEQVTETVESRSTFVQDLREVASEGGRIVEESISGIRKASDSIKAASGTLSGLSESSLRIGEVVTVIEDIADQTNLLALNAAIEAARAGDHGRGFAVVADEVRKLAEKTVKATSEISAIIGAIQNESHNVTESVSQGMEDVNRGADLADQASQALRRILDGVEEISVMIKQIASATTEQSQTLAGMNQHIEEVAHTAREVADGTSATTTSVAALDQVSKDLEQTLEYFQV